MESGKWETGVEGGRLVWRWRRLQGGSWKLEVGRLTYINKILAKLKRLKAEEGWSEGEDRRYDSWPV